MKKLLDKKYNVEFFDDGTFRIKIVSDLEHLLYTDNEYDSTVKDEFELDDNIDVECMKVALSNVKERYPYLFTHLYRDKKNYYIVGPCDEEIPLINSKSIETLGSKETNYYYLAFSYFENHLYVYLYHIFMDGNTTINVCKTLFYYYFLELYKKNNIDEKVEMSNVKINDGCMIKKEEYFDHRLKDFSNINCEILEDKQSNKKTFNLLKTDEYDRVVYNIKMGAKEVMDFVKNNDFSPATFFTYVIGKTIYNNYKDDIKENEKVTVGLVLDYRKQICAESAHDSYFTFLNYDYLKEFEDMELIKLGTIYRGITIKNTEKEYIVNIVKKMQKDREFNEKLPLPIFKYISKHIIKKSLLNCFSGGISYVGQLDFGNVTKHILYTNTEVRNAVPPFVIEVNSINDNFFITIMERVSKKVENKDRNVDKFIEILKEYGINAEIINKKPIFDIRVELPK